MASTGQAMDALGDPKGPGATRSGGGVVAGRIGRFDYFMYNLGSSIAAGLVGGALEWFGEGPVLFVLAAVLLATLALASVWAIKRLHDINMPGWWALVIFVPLANLAMGIFLLARKGTIGPNRYGRDPLQSEGHTPETKRECPSCRSDYFLSDYNSQLAQWKCAACGGLLPRE